MAKLKSGSTVGGYPILHMGSDKYFFENWISQTANYTAIKSDCIFCDTSGGAFTITLPASPLIGDSILLCDPVGSWETNNLTVARNGQNIKSLAEDLICDTNSCSIKLVYYNSTVGWHIM